MEIARPVRAVARAVRNSPTALSVLLRHLDLDFLYAASITIRAMPLWLRRRLVRAVAGRGGATSALVLNANGDGDGAVKALRHAAMTARPRRLRRLIATAAAIDAPELADDLLSRLPSDHRSWPRLAALVRARQGHLSLAVELAASSRRTRRLRRRLSAELRALSLHRIPTATLGPGMEPVNGRVLHLVTNALPEVVAGYTVRTQGITAGQRQRGIDAHVSTRLGFPVTAGHVAASPYAEVDGVPYHRLLPGRMLPRPTDKLLAADIEATAHLVTQLQPAVLHAHSKYVNAQIALAMRDRYGLPVVYEVRGFLEETWRSRGRDPHSDSYQFSRAIESECMSAADAVVTISEGMKDEIVSRGVPAERITVIPNAVDDSFLAEAEGGERVRRKLGVDPGDLLVGVVTTLNRYEGIDVLIDAVAELRRDRVPTRLLVVGDGPERLALAEHADRQGLNGSAIFTGRVPFDTVRAYHAAIDVFCVPRRDTPVTRLVTPLKPLEAMATGRPVVASDLPPLREIVQPERTGSLVAPEDPDALAHVLERFASNPLQRSQLGRQAQLWTAQNRTWAAAAERYGEVYDRLGAAIRA